MKQRQQAINSRSLNEKNRKTVPAIGSSIYLVNNSLHCNIQPKRTSFDANIYMQLHRKIARRAVIQRKFEEGLTDLNLNQIIRKGFKGKLLPENILFTHKSLREKKSYSTSQGKLENSFYPQSTLNQARYNEETHLHKDKILQSSHGKPNLMYNLSLYRKNYKRGDFKKQKVSRITQDTIEAEINLTQKIRQKRQKLITIS